MPTPRPRPAPARWPRRAARLLGALVALAALSAPVAAQQIAYTVQVVALSDRQAALDIVSDLLRQGFPAYAVSSRSTQGDVFRVRVGAFVNRPAALRYAEAMPEVAGGQPVPALAESIPQGITPLAPRLLLEQHVAGVEVRLLPFGDGLALRLQQRSPLAVAEYVIPGQGAVERVRAWQLVDEEGGTRLWVREMPLWPDTWQEDGEEVREGYRNSLLGLVAERLGLDLAAVVDAQFTGVDEVPRLLVVERVRPGVADGTELLGLGLPASGMTPAGPLRYLGIDAADLPGVPAGVRVDLAAGTVTGQLRPAEAVPAPEEAEAGEPGAEQPDAEPQGSGGDDAVRGDGWVAAPDGPFIRLTVPPAIEGGGARSWRAAFGMPLWSDGRHLLAGDGQTLLLYDFLSRP